MLTLAGPPEVAIAKSGCNASVLGEPVQADTRIDAPKDSVIERRIAFASLVGSKYFVFWAILNGEAHESWASGHSSDWGKANCEAIRAAGAALLLDLAIYGQHVVFHAVPFFWRLHRMHHADLEFDVTTGLRFHPGEIVVSMLIKFAAVFIVGPAPVAVLIFEVLLNVTSMFNHGNVRLPAQLDRMLRLFVVTPDMHRVHHSTDRRETDSNFGFNVPWWDRLFGTYRAQPALGHERMTLGIDRFREPRELWLDRMLWQPLRRDVSVRTRTTAIP
jgi:sterol desaturase/sphingolipid hydroxylase (fatty acid hydroxylase superfamily)